MDPDVKPLPPSLVVIGFRAAVHVAFCIHMERFMYREWLRSVRDQINEELGE